MGRWTVFCSPRTKRSTPVLKSVTMSRMRKPPGYPFEPKSNAYLEAGQYWAVPLSDGRFACGRVLDLPRPEDEMSARSRAFLAGLMDWVAVSPPDSEAIAGSSVLRQGWAHVLTIQKTGRVVLGLLNLDEDGITPKRPAPTWGYGVIVRLAEAAFVTRTLPPQPPEG